MLSSAIAAVSEAVRMCSAWPILRMRKYYCVAFATANVAANPGVCGPARRVAWNGRVNEFSSRERR
jgi:hypothetical protein